MSKFAGMAGGQAMAALGGVAVAVVVGGALMVSGIVPDPRDATVPGPGAKDAARPAVEAPEEDAERESAKAVEPESADPVERESVKEPEPTPDLPEPPEISLFRLDPDGSAIIAGRGAQGWRTVITLDGSDMTEASIDAKGEFAEFVTIAPSDAPRIVSLRMTRDEDGETIEARQEVIVAPTPPEAKADETGTSDQVAALTPETNPQEPLAEAEPDEATDTERAGSEAVEMQPLDGQAESAPSPDAQPTEADREDTEVAEDRPADEQVAEEQVAEEQVAEAPSEETQPEDIAARDAQEAPEAAATVDPANGTEPSQATETAETEAEEAAPSADTTEPDARGGQAVLLAGEDGVEVLQPAAAPQVLSRVALDAITYDDAGEVQLAGRGGEGAFVRVYLDNTPITTSRIAEDGRWRTELPQVDTGVYTLRIDEVTETGTVASRLETPFKREDEAVIAETEARAQADAETGATRVDVVTVQPGFTLWAISRERYGKGILYVRVFNANRDRIRDPDLIYPGQVFSLPE